jgi:hypothetical protein
MNFEVVKNLIYNLKFRGWKSAIKAVVDNTFIFETPFFQLYFDPLDVLIYKLDLFLWYWGQPGIIFLK